MILDNDHAKRKAAQEKRILRVNPTVNIIPIHLIRKNLDAASTKTKITLGVLNKPFTARQKREGEAPAVTFNHLFDGQIYRTDWAAPARPGASDALRLPSKDAFEVIK